MEPCVLDAARLDRLVRHDVHAVIFAKTHEDGCGGETQGLLVEGRGHLRYLHDISVEAIVRVLEDVIVR